MTLRRARFLVAALLKSPFLFFIADRKPVLHEDDSGADQHALEFRAAVQELAVLAVTAESHDMLDACPVVPAAIEQHDFAAGGKVRDVALEIPLGLFALGRSAQRHHAANAWIEALGDSLDGPALARRISAFEQHDHSQPLEPHPFLQLHQLDLQPAQVLLVVAAWLEREMPGLLDGPSGPPVMAVVGDPASAFSHGMLLGGGEVGGWPCGDLSTQLRFPKGAPGISIGRSREPG